MAKPANGKARRGGKKNRKHGRNKVWCQAYKARGQREINRAKRHARVAQHQSADQAPGNVPTAP